MIAAWAFMLAFAAPAASAHDVQLVTDKGVMLVDLAYEVAPVTACNFAAYVQRGDYNHGTFFRSVVARTNASPFPIDVIQAATPWGDDDFRYPPIRLESTALTGLRHVAGALSMARDGPDTATSSFFIVTETTPSLDYGGGRNPDGQGFAVFGHLLAGLDVARSIQQGPVDGAERLSPPVMIHAAVMLQPAPPVCQP